MRWTRVARLTSVPACGRRSRVVLTPQWLASSWRKRFAGDGDKQARSPGRARSKPLKPSRAGMPGDPGATVVTNACAYYTSRTRLRVQRAPGIPRSLLRVAPLLSGRRIQAQLGRNARREGEGVFGISNVIARSEATKQSILTSYVAKWIASLRSQ